MSLLSKLLIVSTILSGSSVRSQDSPPRVPIAREHVRDSIILELRLRGVPADDLPQVDEIELPVAVPIAPGATLRVTESCWDSTLARQRFRIECQQPGSCVPFLAYVKTSHSPAIAQSCQTTSKSKNVTVTRKPVIRAGDRATVVYHGDRMRLTTMVTCLDRGAEGDVIRVRNQDGRIFRARISSATLLEAVPQ